MVQNFNAHVQSFPAKIIAGMFGFKEEEFFQVDDSIREAGAPKVSFASEDAGRAAAPPDRAAPPETGGDAALASAPAATRARRPTRATGVHELVDVRNCGYLALAAGLARTTASCHAVRPCGRVHMSNRSGSQERSRGFLIPTRRASTLQPHRYRCCAKKTVPSSRTEGAVLTAVDLAAGDLRRSRRRLGAETRVARLACVQATQAVQSPADCVSSTRCPCSFLGRAGPRRS